MKYQSGEVNVSIFPCIDLSPAFDNKEIALFFRLHTFAFENIPSLNPASGPNPLFSKDVRQIRQKNPLLLAAAQHPHRKNILLLTRLFLLISQKLIHLVTCSIFTRSTLLGNIVSPFLTLFPIFVSPAPNTPDELV